jgi:hypothetical protein
MLRARDVALPEDLAKPTPPFALAAKKMTAAYRNNAARALVTSRAPPTIICELYANECGVD